MGVGPSGCAEVAEAGVGLAGHQHQGEQQAQAAAADGPVGEVDGARGAVARGHPQSDGDEEEDRKHRHRDGRIHSASSSAAAGSVNNGSPRAAR